MTQSDDPDLARPRLTRTEKHEEELNRLGRAWFAEAREKSARDEAEFEIWRREHNKWTRFNRPSLYAGDFDFPADSGGDSSN